MGSNNNRAGASERSHWQPHRKRADQKFNHLIPIICGAALKSDFQDSADAES